MRLQFFAPVTGILFAAMPLMAQQQPGQPSQPQSQQGSSQQPQAQQQGPRPKSQQEMEALQKVKTALQAHNPDAEIQAVNNVLDNFRYRLQTGAAQHRHASGSAEGRLCSDACMG